MEQCLFLEKLAEKISRISLLRAQPRLSNSFIKWRRDTKVLLERTFGLRASQVTAFTSIKFAGQGGYSQRTRELVLDKRFDTALNDAHAILTSIKDEVTEFGLDSHLPEQGSPLTTIELICSRFHLVARQFRVRRSTRTPVFDIVDEYDVQDLLHALLRIHFDDIRAEEWTPSYAGTSSRMDFLLKPEKIVIEAKMTRPTMSPRNLVDQLVVDRAKYETHPDCERLVLFIYDPGERIENPVAIISDLESRSSALPIRVFIFPKNG